jgi:hypothetical protein
MILEPVNKLMGNALWIWKEPVVGHKYIMGVDVSRGDSEDFSSFQIVDFDAMEQVAEFVGKLPPDTMAEICHKWATIYSCFIVIDITGGMGVYMLMVLTRQTNGNMTQKPQKKFRELTLIIKEFR